MFKWILALVMLSTTVMAMDLEKRTFVVDPAEIKQQCQSPMGRGGDLYLKCTILKGNGSPAHLVSSEKVNMVFYNEAGDGNGSVTIVIGADPYGLVVEYWGPMTPVPMYPPIEYAFRAAQKYAGRKLSSWVVPGDVSP